MNHQVAAQNRILTIMSTLAVQGVLLKHILPEFEARTGCTVKVAFDPTTVLMQRIADGEAADIVIAVSEQIAQLTRADLISRDSVKPWVTTGVGVAVKAGAAHPKIDTIASLRKTLTTARSVAYSKTGASGIYFAALLREWGIADIVNAKATLIEKGFTGECVTDGRADIAIQQLSELAVVSGLDIVGPLPPPVQHHTHFSIACFNQSNQTSLSTAFYEVLETWIAVTSLTAAGLALHPHGTSR